MIKAVIFDWAGTLNDNLDQVLETSNKLIEKLGKKRISKQQFREEFDLPWMRFWRKYLPKGRGIAFEKAEYGKIIRTVKIKPALFSSVRKTLEELHSRRINLFVISSDLNQTLHPEVNAYGLSDLFTEVVGEAFDKTGYINEIMRKHALNPAEVLYVGDTAGDVEMGKSAGVKTAGITWGFQIREKLERAKPDYLIDDIKEILKII